MNKYSLSALAAAGLLAGGLATERKCSRPWGQLLR